MRRYVPGPGIDQRVALVECAASASCAPGDAGTQTRHYFADRQGNVLAVTNPDGTLAQQFLYTPFGVELVGDEAGNPFRYTGRRFDAETGLYYYRARYYDADLGRFLQVDPVGYADQWNLYAYVGNNPLNATDPTGMIGSPDSLRPGGDSQSRFATSYLAWAQDNPEAAQRNAVLGMGVMVVVSGGVLAAVELAPMILANPATVSEMGIAAAEMSAGEALGAGTLAVGSAALADDAIDQGARFFRGANRDAALSPHRRQDGSLSCAYCDRPLTETPGQRNSVQVDHITPYSQGGATVPENAAPASPSCNASKGSRQLGSEWVPPNEREPR
ncbi:RHS repeat-associated core domain-containing protein [Maricaulis sp. CAU 1757]